MHLDKRGVFENPSRLENEIDKFICRDHTFRESEGVLKDFADKISHMIFVHKVDSEEKDRVHGVEAFWVKLARLKEHIETEYNEADQVKIYKFVAGILFDCADCHPFIRE